MNPAASISPQEHIDNCTRLENDFQRLISSMQNNSQHVPSSLTETYNNLQAYNKWAEGQKNQNYFQQAFSQQTGQTHQAGQGQRTGS